MKSRLFWRSFILTAAIISSTLYRYYTNKESIQLSAGLIIGQLVIAFLAGLAYMYFLKPKQKAA